METRRYGDKVHGYQNTNCVAGKLVCGPCRSAKSKCKRLNDRPLCIRCSRLGLSCTTAANPAIERTGTISRRSQEQENPETPLLYRKSSQKAPHHQYECFEDKKIGPVTIDPEQSNECDETNPVFTMGSQGIKLTTKQLLTAISCLLRQKGHSSTDVYESVFRMLRSKDCRSLLLEWGDIMGKRRRTKYKKKPEWWPKDVVFQEPKRLNLNGKLQFGFGDTALTNVQMSDPFFIMFSVAIMGI